MNVQILVDDQKVFPWHKSEAGFIRGYILLDDGAELSGEKALDYLRGVLVNADLNDFQNWNGSFAAIVLDQDKCYVISDGISSFPLFYRQSNDGIIISDSAIKLSELDENIFKSDTLHFELFSICPGNETLIKGVFQILAGEGILFSNGAITSFQHGNIALKVKRKDDTIQNVWDNVLDRLLNDKKPSKWLIPLSGGWDSRLLLASLWDRGVRNIVTYTYGSKNSFEVKTAQSVAQQLGVEWHFVEYDNECLSTFWKEDVQNFFKEQSKGAFSIQEQEVFALLKLKEKGIIESGYKALPGYCCDLLAGSYTIQGVRETDLFDREVATQWVKAKHMSFIKSTDLPEAAEELLFSQLFIRDFNTMGEWMSHYERWFTQQKVSKYIISGLRSFEWMGLEWRLPYWDRQWMNLWYNTDFEFRWNRNLFKQWANERYFTPLGLTMSEESEESFKANSWKERLRVHYPNVFSVLKRFVFWRKAVDINNAKYLQNSISRHLEQHGIPPRLQELNPLLAQWVLLKVGKSNKHK